MNGYKINNLPAYANEYAYSVARFVDDELWFYGAYENENRADEVANEINGIVIENTK